jgi:hypothetical protein
MVLTSIGYLFVMITLVWSLLVPKVLFSSVAIHLVQGFSVLRICTTCSSINIVVVSG